MDFCQELGQIIVRLDINFVPPTEKYIERRNQDLLLCRQALLNRDWKFILNIGHKLKGNAESFGFPELGALGKELMEAALSKNSLKIKKCLRILKSWISEQGIPE